MRCLCGLHERAMERRAHRQRDGALRTCGFRAGHGAFDRAGVTGDHHLVR